MERRTFLISGLQIAAGLTLMSSQTSRGALAATVATGKVDSLEAGFQRPPDAAKPYTIWHWMNGVVTRAGITADLESFKSVGLEGVQMFLVGGSEAKIDDPTNQILSDKWKGLFKHALDECARLGLKFGTHNSPGWSSTGFKTIDVKDSMQKVVFSETAIAGGETFTGVLKQPTTIERYYEDIVCWAIPDSPVVSLAQLVNLNSKLKPDGSLAWTAPAGKWVIVRIGNTSTGKRNLTAPVSGQGLEVDKLDPGPLQAYWSTFPADLLELAGDHLGTTFVRFEIDSYEMGAQNWTRIMPAEFQRRRGYDLLPMLLTETGRTVESKDITDRFKYDWRQTIEEMFTENYFQGMQSLVHRVPGMELMLEPYATGRDQPFESNNAGAAADLAMCEFWQKPTTWGWDSVKPTVSGAHTWGRPLVAAEAFTGQPNSAWKVDPYALKSTGDRAFSEGVNKLFFHTSAHQPWANVRPGMTMGQWGTHFGRTQTWWEHGGKAWIEYLTRCQFLLQYGKPAADLLYLVYDRITPKVVPGFYSETIGTDAFLSRLSVKGGNLVLPDGVAYKVLILPDTPVMRPDIAAKLERLVQDGAKVIGPRPMRSPSFTDPVTNDARVAAIGENLWAPNSPHASQIFSGQSITEGLASFHIPPDLEIISTNSQTPLLWLHRRADDTDIYFVSNQTDAETSAEISIPDLGRTAELWFADTGESESTPFQFTSGQRLHLQLNLSPSGSVFVVLRRKLKSNVTVRGFKSPVDTDKISTLSGSDVVAAENGDYQLINADGSIKTVTVKGIMLPLALTGRWALSFADKQMGTDRTVTNLSSWADFEDETRFYSGTATYRTAFSFPHRVAKNTTYVLDLGKVFSTAKVKLNNQDLGTLWKPPYRLNLGSILKQGTNQLEIEVTNLWANRMIGDERFPDDLQWDGKSLKTLPDWLDTEKQRPEPRRKTFSTYKFFSGHEPLLPSGLIGPVVIRQMKRERIK